MRLLRGSGTRGLGGIYPKVGEKLIRPLIDVEREELVSYLRRHSLRYRLDESNLDRRYLRNRIRLELVPYLREKYEPKIVSVLSQLASILREEDGCLESISRDAEKDVFIKKEEELSIDLEALASFPLALKRRVMRRFIEQVKGDLRSISFAEIESLVELNEGKEMPLGPDLVLRREKGKLFQKKEPVPVRPFSYQWDGVRPLALHELGLHITGKKLENTASLFEDLDDETHVYLALNKLSFPLTVRNRREGDRYWPLGSPGRKKLKEILRARKIPRSEREKKPVFLCHKTIVWVVGLPVSEEFKIKKSTRGVFLIEVSKKRKDNPFL
jgi:tRNA(Ile)-lysidine synthase